MSANAVMNEVISEMEIVFDLLDLLSGKGYPPFFSPQSYLWRVKEYHDSLNESRQAFVRLTLTWLRDEEPPARWVAYYYHCVQDKQAETRQWLEKLGQPPAEVMELLTGPPAEEKCRQDLKEQAAYALRLIDENGS